jgi:hypothetical protein
MKGLLHNSAGIIDIMVFGMPWEIRGMPTTAIDETIALIECGGPEWLIRGYVTISDCVKITEENSEVFTHFSGRKYVEHYKQPYAWFIKDIRSCVPEIVPKSRGCVTWVEC